MSKRSDLPRAEALYELFCQVRPFPRERMDGAPGLPIDFDDDPDMDADARCRHCFRVHLSQADDEICAENLAERREHERSEPREPRSDAAAIAAQHDRFVAFNQAVQERAVQAMEQSIAIMARFERLQSPRFPTNQLLAVAACLVGRLKSCREAVAGLEGGAPMAEAFEQLEAHAQELQQLLQVGTFEAGKLPANDLFQVLAELPESERRALITFGGISSRTASALQAFWCAQ